MTNFEAFRWNLLLSTNSEIGRSAKQQKYNNLQVSQQTDIINPFKLIFQDECQNYVRVLAQPDSQTLLVCGTNSFKPKCRTYTTVREVLKTPNNTDGGAGTSNSKISSSTTTTMKQGTSNLTTSTTSTPVELIDDGILRMKHEFTGRGICPLDPRHNSTAIYTGMCSSMYSI